MSETIRSLESQYVFKGPPSSQPSEQEAVVVQRSRSKSYYDTSSSGLEKEEAGEGGDGEGEKGGVGKSVSMSELQNKAAGKL